MTLPTQNLLEGFQQMEDTMWYPWDDYAARMAQTDFLTGNAEVPAVKSFFVRTAPFGGSYMLLGGLTEFLRQLSSYRFTQEVCAGLILQGYKESWVEYLFLKARLRVAVRCHYEGSIALPNEPIVTVSGSLHDIRLVEGMIYRAVNPATLWLTKWSRVVEAAKPSSVVDFAMRRAQGPNRSTVYSYMAGCVGTSNSEVTRWFDIPLFGTMGHEEIQTDGDEFTAFDKWLEHNPDRPVLLVDTINTLESGMPNAIRAFKKQWEKIRNAGGKAAVRIDSGDLAYLALAATKMLNEAGLGEICIVLTNNIDEYVIEKVKMQIRDNAFRFGIDPDEALARVSSYPSGTMPGTCYDQPALHGVAKIMEVAGHASIKLAEDNPEKASIPGDNSSAFVFRNGNLLGAVLYPVRVYEVYDGKFHRNGDAVHSLRVVHPHDGTREYEISARDHVLTRQHVPYQSDRFTTQWENPTFDMIRARVQRELSLLDWSHRRLAKPHTIKLSVTPEIFLLRQQMIKQRVLREDFLAKERGGDNGEETKESGSNSRRKRRAGFRRSS